MSERIPEVKAWDDGTAVMEKNCVPIWHLGCAAINALEAELAERDALLLAAYHEAGGFDSPKGFTNWVAGLRTTLAQPREDDEW